MDINLGGVRPMFAHDVAISTVYKTNKTKNGKIKKEAHTELLFVDMISKQAVARIVLPFTVLEVLPQLITDNIKRIKKELKNKEIPEKQKVEIESTNASYLG